MAATDPTSGIDPYFEAFASELYSMRNVADIIGRTLRLTKEAEAVADSTNFERNIHIVNLLL